MNDVKTFCDTYYVDRKQTDSEKWDGLEEKFGQGNLLPLWVADMDFQIPEKAREALMERVEHGVFGYSKPSDTYFDAFINWQQKRHGIELKEEWVRFTTGVVNSFNFIIQAFSQEGDAVLVLPPVYYPFFSAVEKNNRVLIHSELRNDGGAFTMDFADIEQKIIAHNIKILLHCSPHNPVGRVWTRAELTTLFDICQKHGVLIISDEIHQDFIREGQEFVSALRLDEKYQEMLFVLTSASKSFNLAGLLHSHVIIPDEEKRRRFDAHLEKVANNAQSTMGMIATEACYRYGEEWFDSLQQVIEHNYQIIRREAARLLPKAVVSDKQGTYLAWLDLSSYVTEEKMTEMMQERAQIAIDYGSWFSSNFGQFIRINLATKPENIELAMARLADALTN